MTRHLAWNDLKTGRVYRFKPSKAMQAAGFQGSNIGDNLEEATAYVEKQNSEWDQLRQGAREVDQPRGNINWLIGRFEKDPVYYGDKAPATKDEIDYAFRYIAEKFGLAPIATVKRKHCKAWYAELRDEYSMHKAKKILKWTNRLFDFAVEMEARDDNPASRLKMTNPPGRDQVWSREEVDSVIDALLVGYTPIYGPVAAPRPSVALAVLIAYDTSLPQQDVLALTWDQFDGDGLTVTQKKRRAGKPLWIPLSKKTHDMLAETPRTSTHIIVSEETGHPYPSKNAFGRIFRRYRRQAGVRDDLTFMDLRRTALTELGNMGATNAEIVSFSGHKLNSKVLDTYVKPDKQAAKNARQIRDIA